MDKHIVRQCEFIAISGLLGIYNSVKYEGIEIELKRRAYDIYIKHLFIGSRRIVDDFTAQDAKVCRFRVRLLMN